MKTTRPTLSHVTLLLALLLSSCAAPAPEHRAIRVAVIGGMMRTGLWPELARRFEVQSGYQAELARSGNREVLAEALRAGQVDLVAVHAGETASNLVSQGYGRNMRPWTRNEFVILGPTSDPAGIRGLHDGGAALARIARAQAPFIDYQNSGPRDVASALWTKAGIRPQGAWLLEDDSESSEEVLEFARKKQAYLVLGRIPVSEGTGAGEGIEILVQGDPDMYRLFVVLEANPTRCPQANVRGARALAKFLLSPKTQNFLFTFATNSPAGLPRFYPINCRD